MGRSFFTFADGSLLMPSVKNSLARFRRSPEHSSWNIFAPSIV